MENPFVFGKVVKGAQFCNRKLEMGQIQKLVASKQHMVIISPRRYGKTSLVVNALESNKVPYLYLDCSFIDDEAALLNAAINEYAKQLDSIAIIEKFLRRFDISFSVTLRPISISIKEIKTDSLKGILAEIGTHYVLVFDEFQDIYEKDKALVNKIRSAIQFLRNSVIMLGSKRHLLNSLFLRPRGILYNFGYALQLDKIGRDEFRQFIMFWFNKNDLAFTPQEAEEILEITGCHPFFTQYLSHFVFEKRLASKTKVREVLQEILNTNSLFYEETYRPLPANQKKALLLLASGEAEVYSSAALQKFKIRSSQALQKALNALVKKELIDKNGAFHILDVFFTHWLYRMVLNQKV